MSGYFYSPPNSEFNFSPPFPAQNGVPEEPYPLFVPPPMEPLLPEQMFNGSEDLFAQAQTEPYYQQLESQQWMQPMTSTEMGHSFVEPLSERFMDFSSSFDMQSDLRAVGPPSMPSRFPSTEESATFRATRAQSMASNASSTHSIELTRGASPSASEMSKWGFKNSEGTWSCAYPGCSSRSAFSRGCDLRKHFKRHTKTLFCRHEGCPQSVEGGFSSKKDRSRHEAKHNPGVVCEWDGCERLFSRQDNMVSAPNPDCLESIC